MMRHDSACFPKTRMAAALGLGFLLVSLPELEAGTINCLDKEDAGAAGFPCSAYKDEVFDGFTVDNGGNDKEGAVEAVVGFVLGVPVDLFPVGTDIEGNEGDFDFDPDDLTNDSSFDWSYSGSIPLGYLTVKAATGFAIFDILGESSGSIDLDDLGGIIENNGGNTPDVSHVGYWSVVPEPSSLWLMGTGLLGGAFLAWRRRMKDSSGGPRGRAPH